ncbi:hypothetical protein PGT21_005307 [Puccinia graminis f. sp. tritici]|uniref:Uncharacterized protein n=1 Tax=Puccinia graminis f. sp. tritici TaxID=56615 RepID=A0A5B0RYP0_PUCGR|nr:hypothetical protein PGT21_005307 [Puccinia graminis f. sp. tritici]KAA1129933.1 hypothetical protein PGTUg99_005962 [Puccinia graminis f. sp. tritici]
MLILVGHRPVSYKVNKAHLAGQEDSLLVGSIKSQSVNPIKQLTLRSTYQAWSRSTQKPLALIVSQIQHITDGFPSASGMVTPGNKRPLRTLVMGEADGSLARLNVACPYTGRRKAVDSPARNHLQLIGPDTPQSHLVTQPSLGTYERSGLDKKLMKNTQGAPKPIEAPLSKIYAVNGKLNLYCRIQLLDQEEGILALEVVQPCRPNPPGQRGCTTLTARRIPSRSTRLYSLAGQDSLTESSWWRGCTTLSTRRESTRRPGFPPGRRGCTTLPARRIPSWPTRWALLTL